ncbi:stealth conserved region 3 domain-containing protein [Microbacterium sp. LRZ72]|uniref:stealth conserved region 3 domain-containing protein n=1 Tax=Microbacterium sp. LRZ72 TaxID=2942481 RepID=UPI0029B64AD1|nr:stealth conserved region 3 domain-containing protein [Microbacterium sp. LRZ72]MDX2377061.1 stealth conserved region 3 domain-containing protein [Microbacterium sp. LRZ72]
MTPWGAVSAENEPGWARLLRRQDVVVDGGLPHLVAEATPAEAERDDLLRIADTLERAGIEPLLIRRASGRPALAVRSEARGAALAALTEDAAAEPWIIQRRGGRARVLAVEGRRAFGKADAATLFRPRVHPGGSLHLGVERGIRLEFWHGDGTVVRAPHQNALTRRIIAVDDLRIARVERYGRSWRTLERMFVPGPAEFTDDVDIVFSWVDGSGDDFQRERARRMRRYVVGDGDEHAARYRHLDEIRYALRSVHMFAPWIRRIFIATDSPAPWWLLRHPKVTIVRSEEFFAEAAALPTHNSHAVEAQLHRIDGLAEHFLYANDDMFFGRPVRPELFFTPGGISRFVESKVRIGTGGTAPHRSGHDNAARVNRDLLEQRFGRVITRDLEHCAAPLRRSVAYELEAAFPEEFARTAAATFRSASDISVTNSLYHYYALMTGRAIATTEPQTRYIQTTLRPSLPAMERLLARRDADMFCLNDGSRPEVPEEVRSRVLRATLDAYFPVRSPWETDDREVRPGWRHPLSSADAS